MSAARKGAGLGRRDGPMDVFMMSSLSSELRLSPKSRDTAAVKIQARVRGQQGRRRVRILKGGGGARGDEREAMAMAQRIAGHPSDRELIGQKLARARHAEQRKQGRGYAESSFDGNSTVVEKTLTHNAKETRTPVPAGMDCPQVRFSSYQDLQLAFEMCDSQRQGALDRKQAHAFLRALGWLVSIEELDNVLDGPNKGTGRADEVWGLKHLVEAMDAAPQYQQNGNLIDLTEALTLLAYGKQRISRNRLVEVSVASSSFVNDNLTDIFIGVLGKSKFRTMAVDDVSMAVMSKICEPPPSLEKYVLKHL